MVSFKLDDELKEACDNWRNSENGSKEAKDVLVALLIEKLRDYNITQLAVMTGIKRTTLYYMMFGREGKDGRSQQGFTGDGT